MSFDYQSAQKEISACPLCGSADLIVLASIDRYKMGVNTVACSSCGFITTNPILSESELDEFYKHHYRTVYSKVAEPSAAYIAQFSIDRRANYVADFLFGNTELPSNAQVLDVGCAEGSLLKAISERKPSWSTLGVEPGRFGEFARSYANCEVVSSLDEVPPRPFDMILLNHVLEHVRDPMAFLADLRERLAPDGKLLVDVPDAGCYSTVADLHVAHLHHFTKTSLTRLAARAGLGVELMERHQAPKHPRSVRALLVRAEPSAAPLGLHEDDIEAARRVRAIGARIGWPAIRRSLPVRAAYELGRRVADAITR